MLLALLLAVTGGRVYAARVDAGGAQVAVWRYAAAGERRGPPVVLFGELGFDRRFFDLDGSGLAPALQARGREVFVLEWRGTGRSSRPAPGAGGLEALFGGDAPAALEAALGALHAPCAQLVGVGLGGAAAYLLSDRACAVVAVSVPAAYEVPNEAVRRLLAGVRAAQVNAVHMPEREVNSVHMADGEVNSVHMRQGEVNNVHIRDGQVNAVHLGAQAPLAQWAALPSPLDALERRDLFSLLLAHGTRLGARDRLLRAGLGSVAPELAADVARWMEEGDLALPAGPLAPPRRLSQAISALRVPLLVVAAPRDNLVAWTSTWIARWLAQEAIGRPARTSP
jgi:pimeloyl-ACP methyl ester carboxylesterase